MASTMNKLYNLSNAGMFTKTLHTVAFRMFGTTTIKSSHAFKNMNHIFGMQKVLYNGNQTFSFHSSSSLNGEADFKCATVFKTMAETLAKEGESIVKKVNGIYSFNVKDGPNGEEGTWIVDVKNGTGAVEFGGKATPDVTLTMNDGDLLDMMTGKLEPQKAFFKGQLKIKGNMGLAMKLKEFQPKK